VREDTIFEAPEAKFLLNLGFCGEIACQNNYMYQLIREQIIFYISPKKKNNKTIIKVLSHSCYFHNFAYFELNKHKFSSSTEAMVSQNKIFLSYKAGAWICSICTLDNFEFSPLCMPTLYDHLLLLLKGPCHLPHLKWEVPFNKM
jgi:hypothetical protein